MPGSLGPNAGFTYGWADGETGWGLLGFNPNFAMLDALFMGEVISHTLNTPPGSPAQGARYIVGAAPTGAWANQAGKIAVRVDTAWVFYTPKSGWRIRSAAAGAFLFYNGSVWAAELPASQPYDVAFWIPGVMFANEKLFRFAGPNRALTFPANFAGSSARGAVTATASTVIDVQKNGASVGSITFAAGSATGVFTTASGAAVTLAQNDTLVGIAPASADTTLADVAITLMGSIAS